MGQPLRGASSSCLQLLRAFCQALGTCERSPWLGSVGCPAAPGRAQPLRAPKAAPVRAPRSARPAPGDPAGRSSGTAVPAPGTSWRPAPSFKENFLKAALQLIGFCNIANPNVHKSCQTLKNNESSLYITGFLFFFLRVNEGCFCLLTASLGISRCRVLQPLPADTRTPPLVSPELWLCWGLPCTHGCCSPASPVQPTPPEPCGSWATAGPRAQPRRGGSAGSAEPVPRHLC